MKKLLLFLTIIYSSALIYADDAAEQVIGPFGTLNNRDTSATIADFQAQDLLNVDLTPGGKSFKKRKGYGQAFATAITTSPIHGTYDFFDSNGNDIALVFNDSYLTASISGANPGSLFTNGPFGVTYQCIDSQGFAYCSDTSRDRILKTDGVTVTSLTVISTGTMLAVTPDRLVQAGFASAPNRIDFSAGADFTSWATGVLTTSPFQFTITAPGSGIKHITYAFNRIMWFKDSSFGYILPGPTAADWVVKTISPIIGTLDNSSVYYQDVLYFRAQDGNFYSYDGSSLQKISKEIAGTIAGIQKRISNSWTQSTQADFAAGFYPSTTYIDTVTIPGNLQFNYPDTFDSFRDGTNGTKNLWKKYSIFSGSGFGTNISIGNGNLIIISTVSNEQFVTATTPISNYQAGTTFYVLLSSISANASSQASTFRITVSSSNATTTSPVLTNNYFYVLFRSSAAGIISISSIVDSNESLCISCGGDIITVPASISLFLTNGSYQVTANNRILKSGAMTYPNSPLFPSLSYDGTTTTNQSASFDFFGVSPETGTYYSQIKNTPNLTAWDSFSADYQNFSGSNSFFIRSSSVAFQINSATPSWTPIIVGAIPSISTGTFLQIRDDLSLTDASNLNTVLQDVTQNWFEGNATDKAYATYFNDRIWWSVAVATGTSSYNNRVLIYDLLNPGWLVYDIPINGFFLKNLSMYFGSSITGNIYKYGTSDNDNGTAINAYWKSKDFIGSDPFKNEEMRNLSIYGLAVINSTITVTYTVNEANSTSYFIPTYRSGAYFFNSNRNLPLGIVSNSFNVKIGNNAADQPFEIIAERVGLNPKPWNPTSQ